MIYVRLFVMKKVFYIFAIIFIVFGITYKCFDFVYGVELYSLPSFKTYIKSDLEYKDQIIRSSNIPDLSLENLSPIVGPYELMNFITENSKNPDIYSPSDENIKNKVFQANFHSHTTNSDGSLTVQEMLDLAENYAQSIAPKPFYLAITDHNKTKSGKDIVEILHKYPNKYKNLKLVLGMEVFSVMATKPPFLKNKIDIHLVTLAINPYDKDLNTIFFDYGYDKNNYSFRYFEDAIILLNQKGPVGIAHPARYISNYNIPNYKIYIIYLYQKYKYLTKNGFSFTEAYYQSYSNEKKEIIEFIKLVCDKFNINKSGSIDNHGKNFFKKL